MLVPQEIIPVLATHGGGYHSCYELNVASLIYFTLVIEQGPRSEILFGGAIAPF